MLFSAHDHAMMSLALQLAERGCRTTTPNPRVGCVICREDGQIVGQGWHVRAGEAHAEVHALQQAGEAARGATAYVTLEPCSHTGRTPPCADALLKAGIARVVAAMTDPNPAVAGRGLARLQAAGVVCASGLMESEARALNRGFLSRMERGRPWVTMKIGASLDGKTALTSGESQWITRPAARHDVQRLRAEQCAILTGAGTVLADDPQLTVRDFEVERQPLRVVFDRNLSTSPQAKIYQGSPSLLITRRQNAHAVQPYQAVGAEVYCCPEGEHGEVDWADILAHLAARGVNHLMVEAGARLNGVLLAGGWVDELVCYLAPVILGDIARGMFALPELASLQDKSVWRYQEVRTVGEDLRISLRPAAI